MPGVRLVPYICVRRKSAICSFVGYDRFTVLASRSTADEHPAATPGYPRRQASSYASPDEICRVERRCKLVRGALRRAKPVTCVAQIPRRQFICAPGKTWSNFKPNICSSWHKAGKWPLSNLVASYNGKHNPIRDSLMSVMPSIIVLAITALVVFHRELTVHGGSRAQQSAMSRRTGPRSRSSGAIRHQPHASFPLIHLARRHRTNEANQ
jgi:hypothetical protein